MVLHFGNCAVVTAAPDINISVLESLPPPLLPLLLPSLLQLPFLRLPPPPPLPQHHRCHCGHG